MSLASEWRVFDCVRVHPIRTYAFILLVALGGVGCDAPMQPLVPCEIETLVAFVPRPLFNDQVDLLFVIDNSRTMAEEQRLLSAEMPRLIASLAGGGAPGEAAFVPPRELRVGVVTTDMGTGGFVVATCTEPYFGDDGELRRRGDGMFAIQPGAPPFLNLRRGDTSSDDVSELVQTGTDGCGFRQPLEAALKALTPSGAGPLFISGTTGHGDGTNEGFLREDSVLAVVVLSNQDDCSAADPDLYNRESDVYTDPNFGLRCSRYSGASTGALHPPSRYIDGLLSLRDSDQLLFALIGGVPQDLAHPPGESPEFPALVGPDADPRMRHTVDPLMPTQMTPSCEYEGQGSAFPPSRLVRVAEGLAQRNTQVVVQSLCQDSYAPVIDALLAGFAEVLGAGCFNRALEAEAGPLPCEITEILPLEGEASCDELAGRVFRDTDTTTGREICSVCQISVDGTVYDNQPGCEDGEGWFYEGNAERCPERRPHGLAFTSGAFPVLGAYVRFECDPVETTTTLGSDCSAEPLICEDSVVIGVTCDPSLHQCLYACENDEDCRGGGYACYDPDGDGHGSCVNPTCSP